MSHTQITYWGFCTVTTPSVEVTLHVYAAANALLCADRPVLLEGPCAVDRGLIGAGGHSDIVGAAVALEASLSLRSTGRIKRAVRFDYIVFYKGVASPAINREVAVTLGVKGATVVNSTVDGISIAARL